MMRAARAGMAMAGVTAVLAAAYVFGDEASSLFLRYPGIDKRRGQPLRARAGASHAPVAGACADRGPRRCHRHGGRATRGAASELPEFQGRFFLLSGVGRELPQVRVHRESADPLGIPLSAVDW